MIDVDEFIEDFLEHAYNPAKRREYYLRTRKLKGRKSASSESRVINAEKKIARARAAAKKLPPSRRKAVLKKLIAAQKKLNKLKRSFRTTKVTSRVTRSKIKDVSRFGKPKVYDGRIKDVKRAGSGKSTNIRRTSRAGSGR